MAAPALPPQPASAGGLPRHVTGRQGKPWRSQAPVYFKPGRFI